MMNARNLLSTVILTVAATAAAPATARTVVSFEGVPSGVSVNNYYNGGTASDGSGGINLGIAFNGFTAFDGSGLPASTVAYNASATAYGNVAAGFSSISFLYGFTSPGTVSVFSGLNGTGTLLGTSVFAANVTANSGQAYSSGAVAFTGSGQSFVLTGVRDALALDNIRFNATAAVPEPATWGMIILGFGLVGAAMRRRIRASEVRFDAKVKRISEGVSA